MGGKVSVLRSGQMMADDWASLLERGLAFSASGALQSNLATANNYDAAITVAAASFLRVLWAPGFSASFPDLLIYEDAVFTGGTPIVAYNRNRNSARVLADAIVENPSVSNTGTLISGTVNPVQWLSQSVNLPMRELVLHPSKAYLFRFGNNSGATIVRYNHLFFITPLSDSDG